MNVRLRAEFAALASSLPRCLFWISVVAGLLIAARANGELVFESAATLQTGQTNHMGGVITDSDWFSGVNFFVSSTAVAERIGGHFGYFSSSGNNQIFGAVVALDDESDYPEPRDLSGSDVLGTTLVALPPRGVTDNVSGTLSLTLYPGWYALVFGSGKFGAEGSCIAVKKYGTEPVNDGLVTTFAIRQSDGTVHRQAEGARYFVEGTIVPEPSALTSLAALGLLGVGIAWKRKRRPRHIPWQRSYDRGTTRQSMLASVDPVERRDRK